MNKNMDNKIKNNIKHDGKNKNQKERRNKKKEKRKRNKLANGKKGNGNICSSTNTSDKEKKEASRLVKNGRKPGYLLDQAHDGTLKRNKASVAPSYGMVRPPVHGLVLNYLLILIKCLAISRDESLISSKSRVVRE
jgi:hypothetical protein